MWITYQCNKKTSNLMRRRRAPMLLEHRNTKAILWADLTRAKDVTLLTQLIPLLLTRANRLIH